MIDMGPRRAPSTEVSKRPQTARRSDANVLDLSVAMKAPSAPTRLTELTHDVSRTLAKPPAAAVQERHLARFTDRIEESRVRSRSQAISRYGTDAVGRIQDPHKMYDKFGNPSLHKFLDQNHGTRPPAQSTASSTTYPSPAPYHAQTAPQLPPAAVTQHMALGRLAGGSVRPNFSNKPLMSPGASRIFAVTAAVLIMGGYIWLQNYPKLAIESADSRSGVAASLPAYVPTSYNLAATSVAPGLVTLKFTSPSSADTLTIAQQRTDWDPSSLLDNYIAKTTDDYAAVQGQGLTIYMFGQNQATWVNRGIWFSIAGASRLSRDDILKIAYSL